MDPIGKCPACRRVFRLTTKGLLRVHRDKVTAVCNGSGMAPVAP